MLAGQLVPKYGTERCIVMAVNDGGVVVGAEIALQLHCSMSLLLSAEITLPREPEALAGITASGAMAYNSSYSSGEIDELRGEYYNLIEQEKLTRMHDMNSLLGHEGAIDKKSLQGHYVIVVTDGLKTGFQIDLAFEFLKPIDIEKFIVATPLASVPAVDRMHVLADDLYCLSVIGDYMDTDHYYDQKDVPDHQTVLKTIETVSQQQAT